MSAVTDVRKTSESLLATGRKPFYAYAGAADLAAERVRALPAEAKKFQGTVQGQLKALPTQVKTLPTSLQAQVKALQTQVMGLPGQVTALSGRASTLYTELVVRGEKVVGSIRHQAATETAVTQTKSAVSKAKAAGTSARKARSAVGKAVDDAAGKIG